MNVIQGLWIGDELSTMERLSIASFLKNGHPYDLYTYSEVRNVPVGATVRDANEIIPSERIFRHPQFGGYVHFADFFRYRLLLDRGGWWSDTDVVCLRPFEFSEEYVFMTQRVRGVELLFGRERVCPGIIKVPVGSELMSSCWGECQRMDISRLRDWEQTGPRLLAEKVRSHELGTYAQPCEVFSPIRWWKWHRVLDARRPFVPCPDSRAVHLWNDMWRRGRKDKNESYHPDCLYERLKMRFLDE